ncbi:MAG: SGNH/GDSL hydrolase family protein [Gammaproteobacteria bacterium]|nr:SGNH/GDSL hydrolase family protein [Gammaproteobacteria bacterium]
MPEPQRRYLALGDSYSIGEGVPETGRWPLQLAAALRAEVIALAPPRIIATTGWTTDELAAAMDAAEPLGRWDLVSLLIGVNNQYRGRPLDEYREQFGQLLRRAIGLAGGDAGRVFVLSIPDWGVTPFAQGRERGTIAAQIDAFNGAARTICDGHDVLFIDITPTSRERGGEPDMLAEDGLHPSAAMYARWVEAALPQLRALLG